MTKYLESAFPVNAFAHNVVVTALQTRRSRSKDEQDVWQSNLLHKEKFYQLETSEHEKAYASHCLKQY